jgi:hypothetical protein
MADKTKSERDREAAETARGKTVTLSDREARTLGTDADPRVTESMLASDAAAQERARHQPSNLSSDAQRALDEARAERARLLGKRVTEMSDDEKTELAKHSEVLANEADRLGRVAEARALRDRAASANVQTDDARDAETKRQADQIRAKAAARVLAEKHRLSIEAHNLLTWAYSAYPDSLTFWPNSSNQQLSLTEEKMMVIEELRAAGLITVTVDGGATVVAVTDDGSGLVQANAIV